MNGLPVIRNYGDYSSENYGAHTLQVLFDNLTLWYSYQTVIAFQAGERSAVSQNIWGPTTGKHLNWVDGGNKATRIPYDQFKQELQSVLQSFGLSEGS